MEPKAMLCLVAILIAMVMTCDAHSLRYGAGKFSNCGTVPFNFTWSPEPISPSHPLKVTFDYKPSHAMNGGGYNATIWFEDDPYPFLQFVDKFDCSMVKKYIPCPIPAGVHVHLTKVFEHILNIGSYPGAYIIRAEIKNEKGEEMICMKGKIVILKN